MAQRYYRNSLSEMEQGQYSPNGVSVATISSGYGNPGYRADPEDTYNEDKLKSPPTSAMRFDSYRDVDVVPPRYRDIRRNTHDKRKSVEIYSPRKDSHQRRSLGKIISAYTANNFDQSLSTQQAGLLQTYSSVSYLPTYSELYLDWLRKLPERLNWDRWLINTLIAICVGIVAMLIKQCHQALDKLKWDAGKEYLQGSSLAVYCVVIFAIAGSYGLASSFSVVFIQPVAVGGGAQEVLAFLNGVIVHGTLKFKTLVVKFVALVFAISSGLPAGTQGPLIALGAIMGNGIAQLKSKALGIDLNVFSRLRNPEDRRTFTTAGVAAGVAAGFNAPIGGLLFAMEDLSSFWNKTICWHTFYCSAIAALTASVFNTAFIGFIYQGYFGLLTFSLTKPLQLSLFVIVPSFILGILGGLLGAFYTNANVWSVSIRKQLHSKFSNPRVVGIIRMVEVVIIVLLMVLSATVLPNALGCTTGNITNSELEAAEACGYPLPFIRNQYNCIQPDDNETVSYSELATLLQGTGSSLLQNKLWSRGTWKWFSWGSLLTLFCIWFLLSIVTCGSAIAGGIFLPTLISGALYGRLLGIAMIQVYEAANPDHPYGVPYDDRIFSWIDPGLIAVIGSGSLLGGITRLNVAVTVIVVEMSNDLALTVPILFSIWVAKMVADMLRKPLFHYQLDAKGLPYLHPEPRVILHKSVINLELFRLKDIMVSPVLYIKSVESVASLAKLLEKTSHGGYPVCKYDPDTRKELAYGLITRNELYTILCSRDVLECTTEHATVTPNIKHDDISVDYLTDIDRCMDRIATINLFPVYNKVYVNLEPFVNQSIVKLDQNFSLKRGYDLFRALGLRHMIIIDLHNNVQGIITRKDLVAFSIKTKLMASEELDVTDCSEDTGSDSLSDNSIYLDNLDELPPVSVNTLL